MKGLFKQLIDVNKSVFLAKVKSIENNLCTCEMLNGDADVTEVRIQTENKSTGFVLFPKIGSIVAIELIEHNTGVIIMYSDVDKCLFNIGGKTMEFTSSGLSLYDDSVTFKDELNTVYDIIYDLINEVLKLKVLTPVGPSTGLMPDNLAKLIEYSVKIKSSQEKINLLIK